MKKVKTKTIAEASKHFEWWEQITHKRVGGYWVTTLTPEDDPIYTRGYVIGWTPVRGVTNKGATNASTKEWACSKLTGH
jgi:hypothetical protein